MGLREWVIGLAVILMIVLAADAWRRIRQQKKYRGAFVKPRSRQGSGSDKVRVSRVAGRAPVTAPGHYSSRRPAEAKAAEESPAGPDADEPAVAPQPETDAVAEAPENPRNSPFSGASYRSRGARVQSSAPTGSQREKVPMLLDSVEDPEPEPDTGDAYDEQFEFDLQPPTGRSAPGAPTDRPDTVHEDSWEDEIDPDDVLLNGSGSADHDFAAEFSASMEAVQWQQSKVRESTETAAGGEARDPEPAAEAVTGPASEAEQPRTDEPPSARAVPPADVSPYAHLQRSFRASEQAADLDTGAPAPESAESPVVAEESSGVGTDDAATYDAAAGDQLLAEPEQVLVITVLARQGEEFEGSSLLQILLACGMRFGNMNIFHATDDQGRLQYSAANAYNPGTFDLNDIEHFTTRGVTFFMQLPCNCRAMEGFEAMYHAASTLASNMNGEILDDTRSVMTTQTLTHYQERIRDYQRAQLVKRA